LHTMKGKIKILCIEDNPGDARIIRELFNDDPSNHYDISFADNLEKVRLISNELVFDCILLDLSLPDSSGIDTLSSVQLLIPDTPIIVLTGLQDEKTSDKTMGIGAQDYLFKNSITTELLTHAVKYAIDRHCFSKKLKDSEEHFKTLIENDSDGIMAITEEGIIKYINPSGEKLFSKTKDELVGQLFGFPITNNDNTEITLVSKGGKLKTVEMRATKIILEDKPCILASLRDISVRKELEEKNLEYSEKLERANLDKDKFFSIIAHDLRSPLNSFLGLTELMVEDLPSMELSSVQEMAVSMQKSALNLFRLIENLLEWAKMQRGLIPFKPEVIPLNSIVVECIEMVAESIKNKKIEIFINIPAEFKAIADANMLKTVIRNFVSNAAKFTPRGGKIQIAAQPLGSQNVEISITDSGIGMSPEMVANLFQLNNQVNRKGTEGEPSTGLGLLLCKEFIEKLGGNIRVESQEGAGTVFYFTLPQHIEPEEKEPAQEIELVSLGEIPLKNLKILVAEDDAGSEMLISFIVRVLGKEIIKVRTGIEAVEACRNHPDIDLVLMDIRMPEMNGYDATRQIRQFNKEVIIIAQTAFVLDNDRERAIEAGCNDYISKPVKKPELLEIIQKYFKK
jgi:signal transduction histidine kinase/DNA-binding response OmpR family regulator